MAAEISMQFKKLMVREGWVDARTQEKRKGDGGGPMMEVPTQIYVHYNISENKHVLTIIMFVLNVF